MESLASVFANEQDKRRYYEAIANGASEEEALKVGDNQLGAWGDYTGPGSGPIVAIHGAPYGALVRVTGPKGEVIARNADKAPDNGRIDLNPDAANAVGHNGGLTPVNWEFVDNSNVDSLADPSGISLGGELSSASLPAPVESGLGGIPGVHQLTPIGSGEAQIVDQYATQPSISDATIPAADEIAAYMPEQQGTAGELPGPPTRQGYTFEGMTDDGAERWVRGKDFMQVYPDNTLKYSMGERIMQKGPGRYDKPADISPKKNHYVEKERVVTNPDGTKSIKLVSVNTTDPSDVKEIGLSPNDPSVKSKTLESNLTEDGVDYAATQFRITGQMPSLGFKNAGDRARIINTAAEQTKMLNKTPAAMVQRQAARKADTASLSKMSTMRDGASAAESKAIGQTDIISALSDKVPRTQFPLLNKAIIAGQKDFAGDSNSTQLFNAITTFASEYGKIIEGSTGSVAGASESARAAASKLVNAAMNKETLADVLKLMKREMQLTMDGYDATIASIYGRMDETSGEPGITKPAATATPALTPFPPGTPILRSKSTGKYFVKKPDGTTVEVDQNGNPIQ